jgi:succinoglycan biosynthesis transport protein ExoP
MTASPSTSNYVAISRRALDLEDYIDIARRHIGWIVGPLLAGIVISTVVAFALPNVYISQAEMQITPKQISDNIVKTTVNQQLTERIMQMENEILSRTSLSTIIQDPRFNLYTSDRASKPLEDVIEQMRTRDIHITIDSLPGDGARRASAFKISFSYPDRLKAQQIVQTLITKFSDSNQVTQAAQQKGQNNYVHDELSEAKAKLDQLTEQLNKFRVEHAGQLPEQSGLNMAQLTSAQQQSNNINESLNRQAQERVQLDQRLTTLESQIELFNMFDKETGPAAPLARQQNDQLTSMTRTIEATESQLAQMRQIYQPKHPDIRDAENRLKVLKNQRDDLQKKQDEEEAQAKEAAKQPKEPATKATNFAAAQSLSNVQGQIDATRALIKSKEMERANLMKEQTAINKQIDSYQSKLAATSGIEATYVEMQTNQRAATEKYQELQSKQELTEQNGALLERKLGENLEVLDPPSLPTQPAKPNRWMIVGSGAAIGFILGLALAGVQEAKDTSLKNLKDVRAYTNLPVLSSIPLLENTLLVRRKRRIAYLGWSAAIIVGMLGISASLYYYYSKLSI